MARPATESSRTRRATWVSVTSTCEDQFRTLFADSEAEAEEKARQLHERMATVLDKVPAVFADLRDEMKELDLDAEALSEGVTREAGERLDKSVNQGRRLALRSRSEGREKLTAVGA